MCPALHNTQNQMPVWPFSHFSQSDFCIGLSLDIDTPPDLLSPISIEKYIFDYVDR